MLNVFRAFFVLILISVPAFAADNDHPTSTCPAHTPYGRPEAPKPLLDRCRIAYTLAFDPDAKIPAWVAYVLAPERSRGCLARSNSFRDDLTLPPAVRSSRSDYAKSGYDAGHMANDADMAWDADGVRETYLMSNIVPQVPGLNRGVWAKLELSIRTWASLRGKPLAVIMGPIHGGSEKRIGKSGVLVPAAFFKIVVDMETGEALAFRFDNVGGLSSNLKDAQKSVQEIEEETGMAFGDIKNKTVRARVWSTDFEAYRAGKQAACDVK